MWHKTKLYEEITGYMVERKVLRMTAPRTNIPLETEEN